MDADPTAAAPPAPHADPFASVDPVPGVAKPDPILVADGVKRQLRRPSGRRRRSPRDPARGHHLAHRAQRRRQDHVLQPALRLRQGQRGHAGRFEGQPADGVRPHQLARRGMVRTFQLTKALGRMTVLDNMLLAGRDQTRRARPDVAGAADAGGRRRRSTSSGPATCSPVQARATSPTSTPAGLSGGQRKLLEMARALMTDPSLVMLDEPMAGVNPALTQSLLGHVTALRDEGMSVLFVEHDMDVDHDDQRLGDLHGRGPGHRRGPTGRHRRQRRRDRGVPRHRPRRRHPGEIR